MYAVFQNTSKEEVRELSLKSLEEESGRCEEMPDDCQDEMMGPERDFNYNPRRKLRPTGVARNRRLAQKNKRRRK